MPYCVTIRRASSVAFSKSLLAPVVTSPNLISSASRPPIAIVIIASSSSLVSIMTIVFRQRPRNAERHAARNDRHLVDRIGLSRATRR